MARMAAPLLLSNFFGFLLSLLRNGDSSGPLLLWGMVNTKGIDVQTVIQWHEKSPQQMALTMVPMETVLPVTVLVRDLPVVISSPLVGCVRGSLGDLQEPSYPWRSAALAGV